MVDDGVMKTITFDERVQGSQPDVDGGIATTSPGSALEIVRILLLMQGAIFAMSSIESLFAVLMQGPMAAPIVILTVGTALTVLGLAWGVGRSSPGARKAVLWLEVSLLVWAAVDLTLAVVLAQRGLELVPTLTRIVLPIAVFRMLRRPDVRVRFAKTSQRERGLA